MDLGQNETVGTMGLIQGYDVLANYKNQIVLARSQNQLTPEPFVVWLLDGEGAPHTGSYFIDQQRAGTEFAQRCFPWLCGCQLGSEAAGQNPEELIRFTQQYKTHRIGEYFGWLVVQPYDEMDGDILCFMPTDELEGQTFPDLDYLKEHYPAEWEAGSLQEAVDFIDSY